ncbi:MAG: hypothetical protein ACKODB_10315, partial [Betaproteobacteria bacterium]
MNPPDPAHGDAQAASQIYPLHNYQAGLLAGHGSHLTIHSRLRVASREYDGIITFGGKPATLQQGLGQLAEPLERCLI